MSKVRLFSFERFAKLNGFGQEPWYVNPSDIYAVLGPFGDRGFFNVYAGDNNFTTSLSMEQIEAEINRALEATHKAHMDVAEEAKEKVQELMKELNKPTKADPFSMNDFYCDPTKDKN